MKAYTVYQPYALAIVAGLKGYETKPRRTNIRGRVAVHAAKKDPHSIMIKLPHDTVTSIYASIYEHFGIQSGALKKMQTGAVIGTVEIVDCVPVEAVWRTLTDRERLLGDYLPGRFAWVLQNPVMFDAPIPAHGQQGWWEWDERALLEG